MHTEVIMVLGQSVWLRGAGGWHAQPPDSGASAAALVQAAMSRLGARRVTIVYEPAGMTHQEVECPKASRKVFASIARIRSEFPVVVSEDVGWGMEPPAPVAGGSYSTLLHYELRGGLSQICAHSEGSAERVGAAWPVFTVAEACVLKHAPAARDVSLLILLPGFVAFCGRSRGRRSFRVWPQPMAERDWRALVFLAAGRDEKEGRDDERRGGRIAVVSEGEPTSLCPFWDEIRNSGRLETFISLDEFAACAARLPRAHSANLLLGFPTAVSLDPILMSVAVGAFIIAALIGGSIRAGAREFQRLEAESQERGSALREREAALERNRSEIESLHKELPETSGAMPAAKAPALRGVAAAIPDSLTLTRLTIEGDDRFEMGAVLVGKELDRDSTLRSFAQNGLSTASPGGWVFDPASRKLSVRGEFTANQAQ